jgi:hypothetical protein
MKYTHLDFVGDIARVTLDHPSGNRINFAMRAQLLETFERIDNSPEGRAGPGGRSRFLPWGRRTRVARNPRARIAPQDRGVCQGS